jgi:Polysaccharide deacetylase
MLNTLWHRLRGRCQRELSAALWRRPVRMRNAAPLISFTFDDFPCSALEVGGRILRAHGATGTYYVSLGLLNRDEPVGRICSARDVAEVVAQGHELGCHTFGHCDAWTTSPHAFEQSLLENRDALRRLLPSASFSTMSYPINSPSPDTKRRTGRHFSGCRGGGQRMNIGTIDLNHLHAFFIEQARDRPTAIWDLIERNRALCSWLIFATHDVTTHPSPFGCTPSFFADVVRQAVASGARVLPMDQALAAVNGLASDRPAGASQRAVRHLVHPCPPTTTGFPGGRIESGAAGGK